MVSTNYFASGSSNSCQVCQSFTNPTTDPHLQSAVGFSVSDQFDDEVALDLDSKPFGIDPMASATISNDKNEFVGLRPLSKTYLAGVGGKVPVEGIGTLIWKIEDDLGIVHQVKVNDAYYCSQAPLRLGNTKGKGARLRT